MFDKRYLAGVVLALVILLLVVPSPVSRRIKGYAGDAVAPFLRGASLLAGKTRDTWSLIGGAHRARRERRDLLGEIIELRLRVQELEALERENARLRAQVGFRRRTRHRLVLCEVLARGDTSGWWQTIMLNRGSAHGIGPDLPVVNADGLIGRTRRVSRLTTEVLLITDPNSRVSVSLPRTEALGIVRGTGKALDGESTLTMVYAEPPCRLDYVSKDVELLQGDRVETSGLGGVYPAGLEVGRVVRPRLDASRLYRKAEVVLAADIRVVRYAFVILPEIDETDGAGE